MREIIQIILLLLSANLVCQAQSSFEGLMPGKSRRADIERMLGRPLKQLSATLSEYKSQRTTEQIFVQYLADSDDVARIEVTYANTMDRSSALASLNLPSRSTGWHVNARNRLEEYFSTACVVLTYTVADASTGVSRIGYYSRQLFDGASSKLPPDSAKKNPPGLDRAAANNSAIGQPTQPAVSYDDLIAKANGALQAADFQTAIRLSQQAVDLDANKPLAYEIAGVAQLYGLKDLGAAANAMREPILHGGAASFSVAHDHDGFFQSYCQGSLWVSKQSLSYRSNDGTHSFTINRADIKQAGLNSFVGAKVYSFHIKVSEGNKTRNYNFAPGTFSAAESNLILELVREK